MGLRIGLNLLHAMPETSSGWNYMSNLIRALDQNDDRNEYIAFVTGVSQHLVPLQSRIRTVTVNIQPVHRGQRVLIENIWLPYLARQYSLNCMHWFAHTCSLLSTVPAVVTIYDLLVFRNPRVFPVIKRMYLMTMMKYAARSASVLLPESKFTASDVNRFLGVHPKRMIVIPTIIPAEFTKVSESATERFLQKYHLPEKFWLYVAHTYQHKNHVRLLKAYRQAIESGFAVWPLVLRGEPNDAEFEVNLAVQELGLNHQIIRLPKLDYAELPALYSAAGALIFPSLFEGRGIPVLEAMACGCPVACSDIPPLKDSADDAALYFDPSDVNSICEAIYRLQTGPVLRAELSRTGVERLKGFQQEKVISELQSAYQLACTNNKPGKESD